MAIWQYTAYLIPETAVAPDGSLPGLTVTEESFEHPPLPFAVSANELERLIAEWLPPAKSWQADLHAWGDDARHDAEVWYEEGRIGHVRLRIDLREVTRDVVRRVLGIARAAGCRFLEARTFELVAATEDALLDSIRRSRPARFVQDPRGFFDDLAQRRPRAPDGGAGEGGP